MWERGLLHCNGKKNTRCNGICSRLAQCDGDGKNHHIIAEEEESVRKRLSTLALSATDPGKWEIVFDSKSFDVILMSYVSGSIPSDALSSALYENAFRALRPGGMVAILDFFVDNDGNGPTDAALWALSHVSVNPEGIGLVPRRIINMLGEQGLLRQGFMI